jgi:serine/threonine-protein kinase
MLGDTGGTVPYMPPEQITDYRNADPSSDIYATAAALYFLLTGHHLYDFEDLPAQKKLLKILTEAPVPIRSRRSDIPPGLAAAIHRAMEKAPALRFAHARVFREALFPFA